MKKQEYAEAVCKLLDIQWDEDDHTSSGSTVTTEAWEAIHDKLQHWEDKGILSIAKGLEKIKN